MVDMPDRQIDLFIRFCLQNNGRLSARNRAGHFDTLSDAEIARLEQAVQLAYGFNYSAPPVITLHQENDRPVRQG